jgi:hypothetical protein
MRQRDGDLFEPPNRSTRRVLLLGAEKFSPCEGGGARCGDRRRDRGRPRRAQLPARHRLCGGGVGPGREGQLLHHQRAHPVASAGRDGAGPRLVRPVSVRHLRVSLAAPSTTSINGRGRSGRRQRGGPVWTVRRCGRRRRRWWRGACMAQTVPVRRALQLERRRGLAVQLTQLGGGSRPSERRSSSRIRLKYSSASAGRPIAFSATISRCHADSRRGSCSVSPRSSGMAVSYWPRRSSGSIRSTSASRQRAVSAACAPSTSCSASRPQSGSPCHNASASRNVSSASTGSWPRAARTSASKCSASTRSGAMSSRYPSARVRTRSSVPRTRRSHRTAL